MTSTTPQKMMQATLEKSGIPFKRVHCYGSQIVITAWSADAAEKWSDLVAKFAKVSDVLETIDETNPQDDKAKFVSGLDRRYHKVYRVFATI